MQVSVIGLGKLGSPLAAVFADKGHRVIGYDIDPAVVESINSGESPADEPGLDEYIRRNRARLSAVTDAGAAVQQTDCTFVIVPTPSLVSGEFSMEYALVAAEEIGAGLRRKNSYHLVTLSSTVTPGATEGQFIPALEEASGKRCREDFGVCYNPEFIALGSVIHDLLNPDMVLIGESDVRAGDLLESFHQTIAPSAPVRRMNFVNAELAKLSVNTFVTTRISYANMLAEICEALPGGDAEVVTNAIGLDSRIGSKYLKGALGYGGPCFPRDNRAFIAISRANGVPAPLAEATDEINRRQPGRLADLVAGRTPQGGLAGVLGLSYKPDTSVIEQSQGVLLVEELLRRDVSIAAHDPKANGAALSLFGSEVSFFEAASDVTRVADVVVITTPWAEYRRLRPEHFGAPQRRPVVIDCWRMLDRAAFERDCEYFVLGADNKAARAVGAEAVAQ